MNLTQKETGLLQDLKGQEQLCVEKYTKYSCDACSTELKNLFSDIAKVEQSHLNTVNSMLQGTVPVIPQGILKNESNKWCQKICYADQQSANIDKFLASDMLATEKHVSSLYDVSVFELGDPNARRVLNHIQAEEQQHGEQLYAFMTANGFYQGK